MKEQFIIKKFTAESQALIGTANDVIDDYARQGFSMTLRQIYYQLVQANVIPNNLRSYKNLGALLNNARLAGHIDWDAMEDRTRNEQSLPNWSSPGEFMKDVPHWFHVDMWANQRIRPFVRIEKDALVNVIAGVCDKHDVPYFSCRGYASQSEQYAAGRKLADILFYGQIPLVFYFGDHDPSGMDMTRDNQERLSMFAGKEIEVRRLALNFDQVTELRLPPNPVKMTDTRQYDYVSQYGRGCWELDALRPTYIANLIESAIEDIKDPDRWALREEVKAAGAKFVRDTWARGLNATPR
jgi:hypothetical protein